MLFKVNNAQSVRQDVMAEGERGGMNDDAMGRAKKPSAGAPRAGRESREGNS